MWWKCRVNFILSVLVKGFGILKTGLRPWSGDWSRGPHSLCAKCNVASLCVIRQSYRLTDRVCRRSNEASYPLTWHTPPRVEVLDEYCHLEIVLVILACTVQIVSGSPKHLDVTAGLHMRFEQLGFIPITLQKRKLVISKPRTCSWFWNFDLIMWVNFSFFYAWKGNLK